MDTEYAISGHFNQLVQELLGSGQARIDSSTLEQWLQYWNDSESVESNLRNLEYWLACERAGKLGLSSSPAS